MAQHIAKSQISQSQRPAIAVWVKVDGFHLSETTAVVKMGSILLGVAYTLDTPEVHWIHLGYTPYTLYAPHIHPEYTPDKLQTHP